MHVHLFTYVQVLHMAIVRTKARHRVAIQPYTVHDSLQLRETIKAGCTCTVSDDDQSILLIKPEEWSDSTQVRKELIAPLPCEGSQSSRYL